MRAEETSSCRILGAGSYVRLVGKDVGCGSKSGKRSFQPARIGGLIFFDFLEVAYVRGGNDSSRICCVSLNLPGMLLRELRVLNLVSMYSQCGCSLMLSESFLPGYFSR